MQAGIKGELVLVDGQSLHCNPTDFVTLLRALKARRWRRGVRLLGKSTGSYGEPAIQEFTSPKVDVQAWPLSNTTVQEELL